MASWTDTTPPQFNQYVQQLPVEAMVEVGMHKQQKYEEGIQKIQTSIDNIAGLDVVRDVDKAYLQSKLNQLGNNLKFVSAGDFSDFQLTNTTVSMTNNLANDPGIQTAVSSTAKYRKELSILEKDRADGKLTPENEYYFNKQASAWFNDSNVRTGFSGKYVPFFDVFKYTKETFDAIKPDGYSYDQIFETDSSGQPLIDPSTGKPVLSHYMKRLEKEGIFPEKVKETLDHVFSDGRVNQQLNISGQYNYRNTTPTELVNRLSFMRDRELEEQNENLINLKIRKYFGEPVDDHIDAVSSNIDKTNQQYTELAQTAGDNPDSIRGMLYRNETRDNFTKMFSWSKVKEQIHRNPAFDVEFDLQKEANRRSEWAQEQEFNRFKWAEEKELAWAKLKQDYELGVLNASGKKGKTPAGAPTIDGMIVTPGPESSVFDPIIYAENQYTEAANDYSTKRDGFIWDMLLVNYGNNSEKIVSDYMERNNVSRNKAISNIIKNTAKANNETIEEYRTRMMVLAKKEYNKNGANVSKKAINDFKAVVQAENTFNIRRQEKAAIDKAEAIEIEKTGLSEEFKHVKPTTITFKDKQYNISAQDKIDIATYVYGNAEMTSFQDDLAKGDGANLAAKTAYKRLQAKGLGEIADRVLNEERMGTPGIGTPTVASVKELYYNASDTFQYSSEGYTKPSVGARIGGITELVGKLGDKSFNKVIKAKSDTAARIYNKLPNSTIQLKTGDNEIDRNTISSIRSFTGAFSKDKTQNASPTFKQFQSQIMEDDAEFYASTTIDETGNPAFAVNVLNKDGKVSGSMVLLPEQAMALGLDPSTIYESPKSRMIRERINKYGNRTSAGDPSSTSTYRNGDYILDEAAGDFPRLRNNNYRVKVNIAKGLDGLYYPYIYTSDNSGKSKVYQLDAQQSVDKIYQTLQTVVDDNFVNQILNSK